jgi:putative membrane protein
MQAVHHGFLYRLLLRWFVCSLGLWVAAGLLHGNVSYGSHIEVVIIAGLLLAGINAVIRPIIVFISIPALLVTLGLFMLVINGLTVYIASKLYSPLQISSFGVAILTGVIIGLVNYLVTAILEERN